MDQADRAVVCLLSARPRTIVRASACMQACMRAWMDVETCGEGIVSDPLPRKMHAFGLRVHAVCK